MNLILLLQTLIPLVPLLTKANNLKKGTEILKGSSGITEASQLGYVGAAYLVMQDIKSCGEVPITDLLGCVSNDHLAMLVISFAIAFLRGNDKQVKV